MPFIKREGRTRLYYEVHGDGRPLILSHGYSSTSQMWEGQVEAFTKVVLNLHTQIALIKADWEKAGYKLIIWDMRGHGRSFYPEAQHLYSEKLTVEDMEAILDKVVGEGNSAIVGGLSLGGYMSQAFYRDHPERVEALLIIDTGPGFKKDSAREAWNKTANETADRFDRVGLTELRNSSPERARVSHRNAEGLAMAARGMLAQQNSSVIEALSNIKVPALVLVGGDDKPFFAATDYMAQKIKGSKKVVIPNAGHAANIDQPKLFNEAVLEFLKGLEGRGGNNQKPKL